ncbi:MAG: hypothetical protein B2I17_06125 [Thermoplasmatales archaeon B_DKE]|nr:MAG: hypothetical protein B2I17_06125 [Thermoplasmatales archaeon B_DKE]QRF75748.1 hypothetical protein Thermo_01254 [Thermoplasmatales archaeon]
MNMDSSSGKSSLSGREFGKVREDILRKTIRMKEKIGNRYNLMSQESNMDNVKSILRNLAQQELEDKALIEKLIKAGKTAYNTPISDVRDYEMLDHLISDDLEHVSANDLNGVLLSAIKTTKDLHNLLELMSKEYTEPEISGVLNMLAQHELRNKGKIEELYEEFVNKNYW